MTTFIQVFCTETLLRVLDDINNAMFDETERDEVMHLLNTIASEGAKRSDPSLIIRAEGVKQYLEIL